jgi:predicted membrane protein
MLCRNFSFSSVFCLKLGLYLIPLESLYLFYDLVKCIQLFFSYISSLLLFLSHLLLMYYNCNVLKALMFSIMKLIFITLSFARVKETNKIGLINREKTDVIMSRTWSGLYRDPKVTILYLIVNTETGNVIKTTDDWNKWDSSEANECTVKWLNFLYVI